jgi:hypothetical protein
MLKAGCCVQAELSTTQTGISPVKITLIAVQKVLTASFRGPVSAGLVATGLLGPWWRTGAATGSGVCGCDIAQGHHFSRPLTAPQILDLLAADATERRERADVSR